MHATVHTGGIQPEKMKEGNQDWCQGEVPKVSFLLWGDTRFLRVVHLVSPGDATPQSAASIHGLMAACAPFVSHLSAALLAVAIDNHGC